VQVRIVAESTVKGWCESHSVIKAQLLHWLGLMKTLESASFSDLRRVCNTADQVPVASGRHVCVFNLGYGKNAYRLIAAIHFNTQKVYTLLLLTHAEYDKGAWKNEL
jgi:mRNA interferase HigB